MKIDSRSISYLDESVKDWIRGLDSAKTWQELHNLGFLFSNLFPDAYDQICATGESGFEDWQTGLARERKNLFAGVDWAGKFGCIIIPELAMKITLVANEFQVPWGLAFRKCLEAKYVKINKANVAKWCQPVEKKK